VTGLYAVPLTPSNPAVAEPTTNDAVAAAHALGLQLQVLNASTDGELDLAFATLVQHRVGAFVVGADSFFNNRRDQIVALAVKVELIINLKTAKALGLTFPFTLLGRADEVIE
jgi:hypothetical protein